MPSTGKSEPRGKTLVGDVLWGISASSIQIEKLTLVEFDRHMHLGFYMDPVGNQFAVL